MGFDVLVWVGFWYIFWFGFGSSWSDSYYIREDEERERRDRERTESAVHKKTKMETCVCTAQV